MRDRNGCEVLSIVFRYIRDGQPTETLLGFEKANDITAVGLSQLIIERLQAYGIDNKKLLSQCYDGTPVMSGSEGGVQLLIQKHYNRKIPYVHCFNHRLHLVLLLSHQI